VLVLAIAVAIAMLIPLLTRGSYDRLLSVEWKWGGVLFAGLGIQIAFEYYTLPRARWDDLGFGLLLLSYVFILAFCGRNLVLRGMGIVMIGVACNAIAIAANQGMPVKILPSWSNSELAASTVKHQPQEPDDNLIFLTDIIVLDSPLDTVISFGDLILLVGICDVAYHASRRRKPRARNPIDLTVDEVSAPAQLQRSDFVVDLVASNGSGDGNGLAHDALERGDDAWVVDVRGS
jgi:hypothetical protein